MYHSIALKEYAKTKYIWKLLKTASLSACSEINNPDASVGVCCSHKVVAVGFNTLCYDASVGVLNPRHE